MKGKNFSCNNLGQRKESDLYSTPYSITEQLLENEKFDYEKSILEPACGKMAMVKILKNKFKNLKFYDAEKNFFLENEKFDYIITNPPFSLAMDFVKKAKEIAKEKFAFLLPLSYLHGQKRYEKKIFLDENYPLKEIYVFTRYPLLNNIIRDDGKYNTGMMVYSWYVWEKKNKKSINPIIKWINNNDFVLKRNEE